MTEHYSGWRKASYSEAGSDCIEAGRSANTIGVRDTKAEGSGPILRFTRSQWSTFLKRARA